MSGIFLDFFHEFRIIRKVHVIRSPENRGTGHTHQSQPALSEEVIQDLSPINNG